MNDHTMTAIRPAEDVAVGYSARLSFDEAFADAIARLPRLDPTHPDMLETVRVTEIGAMIGGLAGQHRLFVSVRRTHD